MTVELSGHYGYRRIVKTMFPMVMMMIVTSVYSIVDGFFVSNFAGSDAFAGMNLVWPVISILSAIGLMVGTGGSALVSKTFGEGRDDDARRYFTMLVKVMTTGGVFLAVLFFIMMPQVVDCLGADSVLRPYAILYGRILIVVLPAFMLQMAFQSFYMVAEKPQLGTLMSIVSGVTNIVLDALFVAVFKWGLAGAAVASALGLLIGGTFPLFFFSSRRNDSQLRFVKGPVEWDKFAKSCTNGLSEFVGNIALSVVSICYNLQLMKYIGADGVSAYGIVMYVGFIFAAVFIGYNTGISQIVSYNYGAGNYLEMRSLLHKSMTLIAIGGAVMTALAEVSAPAIAHCFFPGDPDLCALTVHATRIYMLSFLLCGFNMFTSAWFTALNNGVVSAVAAFVRTLVFEMSVVMILPSIVGIEGIWYSVDVAEVLAFVMSVILILCFRRRYGY